MSQSTLSPTASTTPTTTLRGASNTLAEITPRLLIRVDWLSFTIEGYSPEELAGQLLELVPGDYLAAEHGAEGYERMLIGPGRSEVLSSALSDRCKVVLPGSWCKAVEQRAMRELLLWALGAGASFRRLDLAADDYGLAVAPRRLYEAAQAGELVTHIARKNISLRENLDGGATFSVGSRSSRQYLRVYDKNIESAGEVPAIRWELEAKGEAAQSLAAQLLADESWGEVWASRLVQLVDFREVTGGNTSRRPRVGWFLELVGAAKKAQVYGAQVLQTLERVAGWVQHQVAPSLALLFKAMPDPLAWLGDLLTEGEGRWGNRHKLLLAAAGIAVGEAA